MLFLELFGSILMDLECNTNIKETPLKIKKGQNCDKKKECCAYPLDDAYGARLCKE